MTKPVSNLKPGHEREVQNTMKYLRQMEQVRELMRPNTYSMCQRDLLRRLVRSVMTDTPQESV